MKRPTANLSRMRGVAAVEFAIVLIPLVTLLAGVAEFGNAIYQYEALTKATRDAARYLSVYLPSDPAYPLAQAQCLVVYGNPTCPAGGTGTPLAPGLTTAMVIVCDSVNATGCSDASDPTQFSNVQTYDSNNGATDPANAAGSINLVEVKIKGYPYLPITSFFSLKVTFGNIATVMRQVS